MERNRSVEKTPPRRPPSGAAVLRPSVTRAVTRAFFREWARVGYARLGLERVAKVAGIGKAALYRRWPSKPAMATDLLSGIGVGIADVEDQLSLEADIAAFLGAFRRLLTHRLFRRIVTDLVAELERTPELERVIRPLQQQKRARAIAILERAVSRGELSPTLDREAAVDAMAGPLYWRFAVSGMRADDAELARFARMLVRALGAASR